MATLFSTILQTSLYATLVGLILLLVKGLLGGKLNAKWHYLLWMVFIFKLLVPFGPESVVSLFNVVPEIPVTGNIEGGQVEQSLPPLGTVSPIADPLPEKQQVNPVGLSTTINSLLPYIWVIGATSMLLWFVSTYYFLYRRLRKNPIPADERIQWIFKNCKGKMKVNGHLTLHFQDVIPTPSLFGIIHPKILLSSSVTKLNDKEVEYIFLHELAHFKRKDVLINSLLLVLQSIHWFNPILWYIFRQVRQDMEAAADERVLSILEGREHRDYGRALLSVLEGVSSPALAPKLLGMVDNKKGIKRRIKWIKLADFSKKKKRMVLFIGLTCLIVLGGLLLTSGITKGDPTPLTSNELQISVYPEKYALTMSNSPGIRISAMYLDSETVGKVRFSAVSGSLRTWNPTNGKVSPASSSIELPYGTPAFWSPTSPDGKVSSGKENKITITILDKQGKMLDEKQVNVQYDGSMYYKVQLSPNVVIDFDSYPKSLDQAIRMAIHSIQKQAGEYGPYGELSTEGHIILGSDETNGMVKVYAVLSYGDYSFENGVFHYSGTGAHPAVFTFTKNKKGEYGFVSYHVPMEGEHYMQSIKEMFPWYLVIKVMNAQSYYANLLGQQEAQAKDYLKSIGREAPISDKPVKPQVLNLPAKALESLRYKMKGDLGDYPHDIGTRETIENSIRYIYEFKQEMKPNGSLLIFTKTKSDGTVVEKREFLADENGLKEL